MHNRESVGYSKVANNAIDSYIGGGEGGGVQYTQSNTTLISEE